MELIKKIKPLAISYNWNLFLGLNQSKSELETLDEKNLVLSSTLRNLWNFLRGAQEMDISQKMMKPLSSDDFISTFDIFDQYNFEDYYLQTRIAELKEEFEETGSIDVLHEIKHLLYIEKAVLADELKKVRRSCARFIVKLFANNSIHKLISRKIIRLLFKKLEDRSGNDHNSFNREVFLEKLLFNRFNLIYEQKSNRKFY